jgi:hypothetical protein
VSATTLPRKRKKPRRKHNGWRCSVRGCTRPPHVGLSEDNAATVDVWCKTHAKREADRLCRLVVLDRDDYTCQRCGVTEAIQWAHVLTRSELSIRWNPMNSLALCAKCHVYMTHRPVEWMEWVDENRDFTFNSLRRLRRESLARGDKPDYAEIIASLRSQAAAL